MDLATAYHSKMGPCGGVLLSKVEGSLETLLPRVHLAMELVASHKSKRIPCTAVVVAARQLTALAVSTSRVGSF